MNLGGTIRLNKIGSLLAAALCFIFLLYVVTKNEKQTKTVNLKKLLIAAIEVTIKGGKEVIKIHKSANLNEKSKGKTKEGAIDPITDADKYSHCAMYYSLTHTFPDVTVISEEVSKESDCRALQSLDLDQNVLQSNSDLDDEEVASEDVTMWIDPLDATVEFTENLLEYVTVMACVAVKGVPVIGVVHKPFDGEGKTSWAWVNKHISNNINVKRNNNNKKVNIIVSRSHAGDVQTKARSVFGDNVNIISAGGAGYKSLEVAVGNVSLYLHTTQIKKWDICAGNAIINALGGSMTNLKSEIINYANSKDKIENGLIAVLGDNLEFAEKIKNVLN